MAHRGSYEIQKLLQNRLIEPLKKYDAGCNCKITEMFNLQYELECHIAQFIAHNTVYDVVYYFHW